MIKFLRLQDVCSKIVDCPHESPEWLTEGIPVIRNFNLINGSIDMTEGYYVDENTYRRRIRREKPSAGDIIFSREAPIGNCGIVPPNFQCCLGQRLVLLRVNTSVCSPEYLLTVLLSDYVQKQINQVSKGGSIVSNFAISDLRNLIIPIVESSEKIAKVDSILRKKIANNQEIERELNEVARQIYEYWFLQFDFPDETGKPYKSSGGKMVWNSELKQDIPATWINKKLGDISDIKFRSITPDKLDKYYHYSIPAFDKDRMPVLESGQEIESSKYVVDNNMILVSKLNPQFRRVWMLGDVNNNSICSTEFMPFISTVQMKEFLYSLLMSDRFYTFMVNSSSSSTGSRKRMSPDLCASFQFAYPKDDSLVKKYCELVEDAMQKMIQIRYENQELASLRDFLMPMLMNGQVKIKL